MEVLLFAAVGFLFAGFVGAAWGVVAYFLMWAAVAIFG